MRVLDELEQAVREVAERVGPSVVGIGRGRGRGSGVVLAAGLVATNAHNIRGEETTVVFGGDRSAVGRVAGVDVDADLAVSRVDTGGAPAIAWAEDTGTRVGTAVFALANPGGQLRVTFGLRGREPQVALLAAEGLSNADIAQRMRLSAHTVRHYLERVLDRLGLHSRKALALHLMVWSGERPQPPDRR